MDTPVLVTGMGCLSACGLTVQENMVTLFASPVSPALPRRFLCEHEADYPVFELPERFFALHPSRAEVFDTTIYAEAAALEALKSAGYAPDDLRGHRVGICIGTTVGASLNFLEYYRDYRKGTTPDIIHYHRFKNSNPAQHLADLLSTTGPMQTVVNACSSGTDAIGIGAGWIRHGLCDVALVGGTDELTPIAYNGFISLHITADSPCKPFDKHRTGLNLGEGAGILVLESAYMARKRGATTLGTVLGYGTCADAYHLTSPKPGGEGLRKAISAAFDQSGLVPSDIGFVNLHGTATPNNDVAEAHSLAGLLPNALLSATKGYTGHTLGAAGAIEAVFTLECLQRQWLPASRGCETPDPALPVSPVRGETEVETQYAISQSLAFGGNNSVLIFGRTTL